MRSLGCWARSRGVDLGEVGRPELLLAYGSNASVDGLSRKLILENVRNPEVARQRTTAMRRTARRFAYGSWDVLDHGQELAVFNGRR